MVSYRYRWELDVLTGYISDHQCAQGDFAEEDQAEQVPVVSRVGEEPDDPG
jgi:hypothetical protein